MESTASGVDAQLIGQLKDVFADLDLGDNPDDWPIDQE